ncbi:hypothetical protein AAFN88_07680 [Pelagibius sp. CAU 1746]|uniref:hypothetical protein n=1 Tax=Pelagibius sp. CAU 1746 TaxID=3140370 RepID=UPI00325BBB6A
MTTEEFLKKPWAPANIHEAYDNSFLHMRPAPEYASGEVILASTYREVGFKGDAVSEGRTPKNGREFQKNLDKGRRPRADAVGTDIDIEAWRRIITGTLRSPKQPNQAAKRFLQISPVVPDAALYTLSARLSANSWNPGALVARIILLGKHSEADAKELWNQLFHSLSVSEDDDIWARFLQEEFESWRNKLHMASWSRPSDLSDSLATSAWRKAWLPTPAARFVIDLEYTLALKIHLTRRQWISMVEAMLRLGTASYILWICNANMQCFAIFRQILNGAQAPTRAELEQHLSVGSGYWRYGQLAAGTITDFSTGFVKARAGINLLLHYLNGSYKHLSTCLGNLEELEAFCQWLRENRTCINEEDFRHDYQDILESDQRLMAGKKGISANVKEFLRHALGQRQTAEPGLDSYDQGYFLAKKGGYRTAPWIVSLGPVSVLSLVNACTHSAKGPRTVEDLCRHLGEYGIDVQAQAVPGSQLGQTLRNLGLVLDSPDAEGGMVVINPFEHVAKEQAKS